MKKICYILGCLSLFAMDNNNLYEALEGENYITSHCHKKVDSEICQLRSLLSLKAHLLNQYDRYRILYANLSAMEYRKRYYLLLIQDACYFLDVEKASKKEKERRSKKSMQSFYDSNILKDLARNLYKYNEILKCSLKMLCNLDAEDNNYLHNKESILKSMFLGSEKAFDYIDSVSHKSADKCVANIGRQARHDNTLKCFLDSYYYESEAIKNVEKTLKSYNDQCRKNT